MKNLKTNLKVAKARNFLIFAVFSYGKMAADIINNNDKFVIIVETVKNVRDFNNNNYDCNIYSGDEFIEDAMAQILDNYYYNNESNLLYELVKMGLDENNEFVTLTEVTENHD